MISRLVFLSLSTRIVRNFYFVNKMIHQKPKTKTNAHTNQTETCYMCNNYVLVTNDDGRFPYFFGSSRESSLSTLILRAALPLFVHSLFPSKQYRSQSLRRWNRRLLVPAFRSDSGAKTALASTHHQSATRRQRVFTYDDDDGFVLTGYYHPQPLTTALYH